MFGSAKKHLQNTIEEIKTDGLYKDERIITGPQKASIKILGGDGSPQFLRQQLSRAGGAP